MAYPGVAEAACVGVAGELGDDEVKVFVVPTSAHAFNEADLIEFLAARLAHFMVPRFVELVDELPRTATMRVKKFELRSRAPSSATWDREAAGIRVTRRGLERFDNRERAEVTDD
jgi:crotonobetaine/carnitine-CoA ligase